MRDSKTLEALFAAPRRAIFCALFREPERWWTVPELAGRAGIPPTTLRQQLVQLRDARLIRQQMNNGRPSFQADPECPVYAELQCIVNKLAGGARRETILVVEDQYATARITRILLESWGYRVLEAHGGPEALVMFEQNRDAIEMVLTDVIMPEMSGPQLADALLERKPELRIVFMSGYPAEHLIEQNAAFLPKPFNPVSLSQIVRRELDRPVTPRPHMKFS